jgi:hypothetical protein
VETTGLKIEVTNPTRKGLVLDRSQLRTVIRRPIGFRVDILGAGIDQIAFGLDAGLLIYREGARNGNVRFE